MTMKELKNRQAQNEFIAKLQRCMNTFDEADKLYDEIEDFIKNVMPNETSKFDSEQQDYLHILEDYELTDKQLIHIGRKLEENRNERKNWHNIYTISAIWNEHKSKIFNRNNRIFLRENLSKSIKNLDNKWNFRVLSEDEVQTMLTPEKPKKVEGKKRGRKSTLPEGRLEYILDQYKAGFKAKDIAEELNMNLNTVYSLIQRNKDKVI